MNLADSAAVQSGSARITELDQCYTSLRLAAPDVLARVRASIERMGILIPVLVATAIEATRIVVVDGHKRVRIATRWTVATR